MERGFVFERFHERQKVRPCGITLKQYVQVIGHQTVGTKGEGVLSGNLKEIFQQPSRDAWRAEIRDATACAESEKVGSATDVALFWEADGFVEALGGFCDRRHG
jgi:hypothetical protein